MNKNIRMLREENKRLLKLVENEHYVLLSAHTSPIYSITAFLTADQQIQE
jgi:hypothetical protein